MVPDHDSPDSDDVGKESDDGIAVATAKPRVQKPPQYAVLLLNDDYTTMEFVIEVLKVFFSKTEEQAMQVMLKVHHEGRGVAGIYSRDIAETKVVQVERLAQSRGFPLKCDIEAMR
jgi:ATP-dependent Clp protease adaptor protein ClpS